MKLQYTTPGGGSTVIVENVKLTRVNTENLYVGEEFNRTGRKHVYEGTGIIASSTNPLTGTISDIRQVLNTPRGTLYLSFDDAGGYIQIASGAQANDGTSDASN